MLSKVGTLSYKLALPEGSRIHDVFHVSLLKAVKGDIPAVVVPLPPLRDGKSLLSPHSILRARLNCGTREVLVC